MEEDLQRLVEFVDTKVFSKTQRHLRDVEVWVFKGAWIGKKYEEIAETHNYTPQYLQQDIGPRFWRLLSDVFDEQVSKRNFRTVLERHYRQLDEFSVTDLPLHASLEIPEIKESSPSPNPSSSMPRCDWGEAMDVSVFYGRQQELETLSQWITQDRCRLIALLGMGGIGKTTLSVKLSENLQSHFDAVIWRSLRNAPTIEETLDDWIQFLSNQTYHPKSDRLDEKLRQLLYYLRQKSCLLILDNYESILREGQSSGAYLPDYEGYGQLLRYIADTQHKGCLLLTSREKPKGLSQKEGTTLPVRSRQIQGLSHQEGRGIFLDKGCEISNEKDLKRIFDHYSGNPLALKIVAAAVQELTDGDLREFMAYLKRGMLQFEDLNDLLVQQFNRLSAIEQQTMYWLAVNRYAVSLPELEADFTLKTTEGDLTEALRSLMRRSLIERKGKRLTLQPVVMEYITHQFVTTICEEIIQQQPQLLQQYALLKAQSKDYIRQAQLKFILQPIINQLSSQFGNQTWLEQQCKAILVQLRGKNLQQTGYAAGNLLNVLVTLKSNLKGQDFSNLFIVQADLAGACLQKVNFANAHFSQSIFTAVINTATAVSYSPDGQLFAMGHADNKVRIWQVKRYQEILLCTGHTSWVFALAFSPDGKFLASGGLDKTIKLWDISTGRCIRTLQGHQGWIWSVAFSPDGTTLASGSNDRTIKIWNVHTGECLHSLQDDSGGGVWSVAYPATGDFLAAGRDDHTIQLWHTQTEEIVKRFSGHTELVKSIAFSPDHQTLISGSNDCTLRSWDVETGDCLQVFKGHNRVVNTVVFNPDGQSVASCSSDQSVRLWDLNTGQCLRILQGHGTAVWTTAFHPDGQTLASSSNDSTVKFWETQSGQSLRTFQGYCAGVKALALHPNGQHLVSGGDDYILRIWNTRTGNCIHTSRDHSGWIWCTVFSHNQQWCASSGGGDNVIQLWKAQTGQWIRSLPGHNNIVLSVSFSPDDRLLASGSVDKTLRIWSVETGECLQTFGYDVRLWAVKFAADGRGVYGGSDDTAIKLWDIHSGGCLKTFTGHSAMVFTLDVSPDGQQLVSGSEDHTVKLWDTETAQCLKTFTGHQDNIRSVVFSPSGTLLASSSNDQTIKIWDIASGECLKTLEGHTGEVWAIAFQKDSNTLFSASQDETIKVWDIETGACLRSLRDKRPYEGMNISGVTGLTDAEKDSLKVLGAIDQVDQA